MSPTWPLEVLNTTTLVEQNGKTTMTLKGVTINATKEDRRTFKEGYGSMQQGFKGTLDRLDAYLANAQKQMQVLMRQRNKNLAGPPTLLRKAAQPMLLGRLAGRAGREVDDLAAHLFRSPLFVGQLKICRNIKHNQFCHHILLAGDPMLPGTVLKEPPQKPAFTQAHISLSFCISISSKLNAIYRNTETKIELLAGMREKTQVLLRNVRFNAKEVASFATPIVH